MTFKLEKAVSPIAAADWRKTDVDIAFPTSVHADKISDGDAMRIVARAKRRYDMARSKTYAEVLAKATDENSKKDREAHLKILAKDPHSLEKYLAPIVTKPGETNGFCYVSADETEQYLTQQKTEAKCVRVLLEKGDHYFVVLKKKDKSDSWIVDPTWMQFLPSDQWKGAPFVLKGTTADIGKELKAKKKVPNVDLVAVYTVGLGVLDQWAKYKCFGG